MDKNHHIVEEPRFAKFVLQNPKFAWFWLLVRVYVGWQWLEADWGKIHSDLWVGEKAGVAITGFVNGALAKTVGVHPDVSMWYAWFLKHAVLTHASTWSYAIAWGEVAVGLGLILGAFTFLAAFFGAFMNMNYLLAGTVSTNPVMLVLAIFIMMAYRVAGYIGLDYYILKTGRY
jgi:thiosulfate dehydrogenase [quinone] large subunit